MTRQKAIDELVWMRCTMWFNAERNEALDEAIAALQLLDNQDKAINIKECSYG